MNEDLLYTLPLGEFVRARDELVKEMRAAGDKAGAARVKALRKPSRIAWALNQATRADPEALEALLDAGDRLRVVQTRADAPSLREATSEFRRLVTAFHSAAAIHLGTTDERLGAALLAMPGDSEARSLLKRGRLTEEPAPAGFDALAGLTVVPAPTREVPAARHDARRLERIAAARREADAARRRATDLSRQAVRAAEEADRLSRRAAEAGDTLRAAEEALAALEHESQ